MKEYTIFPKVPVLLEPHLQIVKSSIQHTGWVGRSYLSTEMLSVYSATSADWSCSANESELGIFISYIYAQCLFQNLSS